MMKFHKALGVSLVLSFLAASAVRGQVTNVRIPDSDASAGAAANVIPFGSAFGTLPGSWSHLTVVPAAMLAGMGVHAGDRLVDIQFAPCGSGVVHFPAIQVLAGHLVSPLPTFSLANGFADQAAVYDSGVSGPLDYTCVANTWCSLRVGGGNLVWNGVSDVGIYTTHAGLTISSPSGWQGSFWRASTLMRHYVNAYHATSALTSALNGLKIGLVFADPATLAASLAEYGQGTPGSLGVPALLVQELPSFGNNAFGFGVSQALPGSTAVLLVSSAQGAWQIGAGADVQLLVDVSPAATWFPVVVPVDASGTAHFYAHVPNYAASIAGLQIFCQWAIVGDPNGQPTIFGIPAATSPGLRITVGV